MKNADVTKGVGMVQPSFFRIMTGETRWTKAGRLAAERRERDAGIRDEKRAWQEPSQIVRRKG